MAHQGAEADKRLEGRLVGGHDDLGAAGAATSKPYRPTTIRVGELDDLAELPRW